MAGQKWPTGHEFDMRKCEHERSIQELFLMLMADTDKIQFLVCYSDRYQIMFSFCSMLLYYCIENNVSFFLFFFHSNMKKFLMSTLVHKFTLDLLLGLCLVFFPCLLLLLWW